MAEGAFFRKAVGVATALALGAGTVVLAADMLTLMPSAGRYLGSRAYAATVQLGKGERPAANAA